MTNREAIEILGELKKGYLGGIVDAIDMTIEAVKAQEPMLVRHTPSTIICPKCNKQITSRGAIHNEINFCWKCGQAVKWEWQGKMRLKDCWKLPIGTMANLSKHTKKII